MWKWTKKGVLSLINKINPKMVEKVKLLGNRSDINELLQIMNVFLFPSTIEGQPNALIEAMISGVPIVTSNIQPIIETTPEKMHRYLKDPFDVDGYVDLIKDLYNKPKFKVGFFAKIGQAPILITKIDLKIFTMKYLLSQIKLP